MLFKAIETAVKKLIFGTAPVQRKIKDVDSWDGSASRWDSTEAYCSDTLINVNAAAGKTSAEDWVQGNCKLPIREPGDSKDTYVRQAVYAAAGGRGITAVTKPSDVPEDAWTSAVTAAANKLIAAYNEMDEVAPEGVYNLAGKERPQDRASQSFYNVYEQVYEKLWEIDQRFQDMYVGSDGLFAVANQEGVLYKFPVTLGEDGVAVLGEGQQVTMEFIAAERQGRLLIKRQADGELRWVGIVCTAVLNRDNQLDARSLFDGFVERLEQGNQEYPLIDFMHDGRIVLGTSDYVKRSDYALIASGLLRQDDIGEAIAQTLENDVDGYWGFSIQFYPESFEMLKVADGVEVPVYTDGYLDRITICPEAKAASWFTSIKRNREGFKMDKTIKAELKKLVGDEELVGQLEEEVDGVTSRVAQGAIARTADTETETEAAADVDEAAADVAETPVTDAVESSTLEEALQRLAESNVAVVERMNEVVEVVNAQQQTIETLDSRIKALETDVDEKRRQWIGDLPIPVNVREITRPRDAVEEPDAEPDVQDRVNQTLASKGLKI